MRGEHPLRPDLYLQLVNDMIDDAHARRSILNVRAEAHRIALDCGIEADIVERDLAEAAAAASVPMEFGLSIWAVQASIS